MWTIEILHECSNIDNENHNNFAPSFLTKGTEILPQNSGILIAFQPDVINLRYFKLYSVRSNIIRFE